MRAPASLSSLALAGVLAGALAAPAGADQNDPRLPALFERIRSTGDPLEAHGAVAEIWRIWLESGRDDVDALMGEGLAAMQEGRFVEAIGHFGRIVEMAPEFAEGWNKRATAYYLNGDLGESVRDIRRTLALEPRHFGAIAGMGLIFLKGGDPLGALDAFEAVLEIHPHSRGARYRIERLRRVLQGQGA